VLLEHAAHVSQPQAGEEGAIKQDVGELPRPHDLRRRRNVRRVFSHGIFGLPYRFVAGIRRPCRCFRPAADPKKIGDLEFVAWVRNALASSR